MILSHLREGVLLPESIGRPKLPSGILTNDGPHREVLSSEKAPTCPWDRRFFHLQHLLAVPKEGFCRRVAQEVAAASRLSIYPSIIRSQTNSRRQRVDKQGRRLNKKFVEIWSYCLFSSYPLIKTQAGAIKI